MARRVFTAAERAEMVAAYRDRQETAESIAERYGCRWQSVYKLLAREGIPARNHVSAEQKAIMVRAYRDDGLSLPDAAAKAGCATKSCYKALSEAGVKVRERRRVSREAEAELVRLYEGGMSATDAMEQLGQPRKAGYHWLRKNGVDVRPLTEAKRTYALNHDYFASVAIPEQAWLLGLLSADGCVHRKAEGGSPAITLSLQRDDRACLELVKRLLGYEGPIIDTESIGYAPNDPTERLRLTSTLRVLSEKMAADLAALGIVERKSLTMLPWAAPSHLKASYFRGLVDGDGFLSRQVDDRAGTARPHWAIGLCGTLPVIEAFTAFVNAHTGSSARPTQQGKIWVRNYGGLWLPKQIATLLYKDATVYLARKKALADELMATAGRYQHWSHLTREDLLAAFDEYGSWRAAAVGLGINRSTLQNARRRLGLL